MPTKFQVGYANRIEEVMAVFERFITPVKRLLQRLGRPSKIWILSWLIGLGVFVTLDLTHKFDLPPLLALPNNVQATAVQPASIDMLLEQSNKENIDFYSGTSWVVLYVYYDNQLPQAYQCYYKEIPGDLLHTPLLSRVKSKNIRFEYRDPVKVPQTKSSYWVLLVLLLIGGVIIGVSAKSDYDDHKANEPEDPNSPEAQPSLSLRQHMREAASDLANRGEVKLADDEKLSWSDIAGCEEAIERVRYLQLQWENQSWFELWGVKLIKGVLLHGPSGTGKTLLVRIMASVMGWNVLSYSASDLVRLYVGSGSNNWDAIAKKALDLAASTNKPVIVFLDEVEAVAKKRGFSEDSDERDNTLNSILVFIDGFTKHKNIVFVGATNADIEVLDPGFLTRMEFKIHVPMPNIEGRTKIFGVHLNNVNLEEGITFRQLGEKSHGWSGREVATASNEVRAVAARRTLPESLGKTKEEMEKIPRVAIADDITNALHFVHHGDRLDTVMRSQSEEDKWNTSYHEAGHALVAIAKGNKPRVTAVSRVVYSGGKLGMVELAPDSDLSGLSEQQILDSMTMMLGSLAALEQFLNVRDTGPLSDLAKVNILARRMVGTYAMWEPDCKFGPVTIPLNGDAMPVGQVDSELLLEFGRNWRAKVERCMSDARKLVKENQASGVLIATAVYEREEIDGDEAVALFEEGKEREKI